MAEPAETADGTPADSSPVLELLESAVKELKQIRAILGRIEARSRAAPDPPTVTPPAKSV